MNPRALRRVRDNYYDDRKERPRDEPGRGNEIWILP